MTRAPDFLAAASGIGARLVRDAVWYRGQCNWLGAERRGAGDHRALGPQLGGGSAGVALFLAHLHAAAGDPHVRRTALGAIDRALAHTDEVPAGGLYAGRPGIAYAAARCGELLGEERLLARAARLARGRSPGVAAFDVVGGTAGALAALLALARLLGDERLVGRAARLGDELAAAARRGSGGWSWPPPGAPLQHGLCGFGHGASGAAWALLELFAVTGEQRHRDAALRALDYERRWFLPGAGDWPDLRGVRRSEARGSFRSPSAAGWAHGAPGIALARLRAWRILGDGPWRDEAITALAATAASTERALLAHDADFTLADGLAGAADVLLVGGELLPEGPALARRAGEVGVGRYAATVAGWPCGVPGGVAPSLLHGHAGIGLFYLRLHDRAVPSALLIAH
jgi:lantibiotic modifying enzyme